MRRVIVKSLTVAVVATMIAGACYGCSGNSQLANDSYGTSSGDAETYGYDSGSGAADDMDAASDEGMGEGGYDTMEPPSIDRARELLSQHAVSLEEVKSLEDDRCFVLTDPANDFAYAMFDNEGLFIKRDSELTPLGYSFPEDSDTEKVCYTHDELPLTIYQVWNGDTLHDGEWSCELEDGAVPNLDDVPEISQGTEEIVLFSNSISANEDDANIEFSPLTGSGEYILDEYIEDDLLNAEEVNGIETEGSWPAIKKALAADGIEVVENEYGENDEKYYRSDQPAVITTGYYEGSEWIEEEYEVNEYHLLRESSIKVPLKATKEGYSLLDLSNVPKGIYYAYKGYALLEIV